jgi:hypothetical protein
MSAARELELLQERIEEQSAQLARTNPRRFPIAIGISDGPLMYAELEWNPPHEEITAFGDHEREFLPPLPPLPPLLGFAAEIEGVVHPTGEPVTYRYGDARVQPYSGEAWVVSVRPVFPGGYVTTLKSTGPLSVDEDLFIEMVRARRL